MAFHIPDVVIHTPKLGEHTPLAMHTALHRVVVLSLLRLYRAFAKRIVVLHHPTTHELNMYVASHIPFPLCSHSSLPPCIFMHITSVTPAFPLASSHPNHCNMQTTSTPTPLLRASTTFSPFYCIYTCTHVQWNAALLRLAWLRRTNVLNHPFFLVIFTYYMMVFTSVRKRVTALNTVAFLSHCQP